jgi:hypothetical protein
MSKFTLHTTKKNVILDLIDLQENEGAQNNAENSEDSDIDSDDGKKHEMINKFSGSS